MNFIIINDNSILHIYMYTHSVYTYTERGRERSCIHFWVKEIK